MGIDDSTDSYPKKVNLPETPDFNNTPETLRVLHNASVQQGACMNEITVCLRGIGRTVRNEKEVDAALTKKVDKHHVMYTIVLWGAGALGAPGLIWLAVQMFAGSASLAGG